MSKPRSYWQKLTALLNDPAAAASEKAYAQRLLDERDPRDAEPGALLVARESWEIVLVAEIADRYGLTTTSPEDVADIQVLDGDPEALTGALMALVKLHPMLEALIVSTTAGFVAAHFPRAATNTQPAPFDPVLAAAFRAAQRDETPKPKLLTGEQRLIEQRAPQPEAPPRGHRKPREWKRPKLPTR